jgi:hypothetical protein
VLDLIDEAFDEMPLFVEVRIVGDRARPAGNGRYHGRHVALSQMRTKSVRIESPVANYVLGLQLSDQGLGLSRLVHLPRGVKQPQHIAESINGNVDFRA